MTPKTDIGDVALAAASGSAASWTLEERLHRIEVMGKRIEGYIRFMSQVNSLANASSEAKERAVTAFHDRLVVVEKQLGRIQENFSLE